jgi:hypothetical protein
MLAMHVDPHVAYFLSENARWITIIMVAVMTVAFPLTSTLLLMRAGLITDLHMPAREERIIPFGMALMYLGMTFYLLRQSPLHPVVQSIFLGMMVSLLLIILVTLQWKISIHMAGLGGLLGAIVGISARHSLPLLPLIAVLIVLLGVLGTARLFSGTHSHAQVYAGATAGFLPTYAFVVLGLTF